MRPEDANALLTITVAGLDMVPTDDQDDAESAEGDLPPYSNSMAELICENRSLKESLTVSLEFKRLLEHIFADPQCTRVLKPYQYHWEKYHSQFGLIRAAFNDHLIQTIEKLDYPGLSRCYAEYCSLPGCEDAADEIDPNWVNDDFDEEPPELNAPPPSVPVVEISAEVLEEEMMMEVEEVGLNVVLQNGEDKQEDQGGHERPNLAEDGAVPAPVEEEANNIGEEALPVDKSAVDNAAAAVEQEEPAMDELPMDEPTIANQNSSAPSSEPINAEQQSVNGGEQSNDNEPAEEEETVEAQENVSTEKDASEHVAEAENADGVNGENSNAGSSSAAKDVVVSEKSDAKKEGPEVGQKDEASGKQEETVTKQSETPANDITKPASAADSKQIFREPGSPPSKRLRSAASASVAPTTTASTSSAKNTSSSSSTTKAAAAPTATVQPIKRADPVRRTPAAIAVKKEEDGGMVARQVPCRVTDCPRVFATLREAQAHYKTHAKLFKCSVCAQLYSSKPKLYNHFMLHNKPQQQGGGGGTGSSAEEQREQEEAGN